MNGEDEPMEEEWKEHPYYHRRPDYERNTLKRLKRMYQQYKTAFYLYQTKEPD